MQVCGSLCDQQNDKAVLYNVREEVEKRIAGEPPSTQANMRPSLSFDSNETRMIWLVGPGAGWRSC
jgi:hypothetical protein